MIHPHTELKLINDEIGYGVVAKKFIPKGTITWVLDKFDRSFTPREFDEMDDSYKNIIDIYAFRNNIGNYVLCWDHARFVNHSFNSNCLTTAYDFEIAVRDIEPGEQLTDDYGYLNIRAPFRAIPEGTRRKIVYPDDTLRYHKIWDKKLTNAFKNITSHEQPLGEFVSSEMWENIHLICNGEKPMDSILSTYFSSPK